MTSGRAVGRCGAPAAFLVCAALLLCAQQDREERIRFRPGASSATIKGAVVRGTRDRYLLEARMGQTMTVRIKSVGHNAVFAIVKPGGGYLPNATDLSDAERWSGKLPVSGDYVIETGGTRGNADYTLTVTIR